MTSTERLEYIWDKIEEAHHAELKLNNPNKHSPVLDVITRTELKELCLDCAADFLPKFYYFSVADDAYFKLNGVL